MLRSIDVADRKSMKTGIFADKVSPSACTFKVFIRMSCPKVLLAVTLRLCKPIFKGVMMNCSKVPRPGLICTCLVLKSSKSRSFESTSLISLLL